MSSIDTRYSSAGPSPLPSRALGEAQTAAHAKATINGLPVSSSINNLSSVLGGITLTLGASRSAPPVETRAATADDPRAPRVDAQALQAARHYAAIEAATSPAGHAPDGRAE